MDIQTVFQQLGCSESDVRTFLVLAEEDGGRSVLQLSRKLNLPRTTLYGHLKVLMEKGLVKKGRDETGAIFYAESREAIEELFSEKSKKLKLSGELLVQLWKDRKAHEAYRPKFLVFDAKGGAEAILRDILRSREPNTAWMWPVKEMLRTISREAIASFHKERIDRKMGMRVLWPCRQMVDIGKYEYLLGSVEKKQSLRDIKVPPKGVDTTLGYCIYGTKVAFISSQREQYGFIIDSKELAENLRGQFEYLWKQSGKYGERRK